MAQRKTTGAAIFEEKHMISIILYLATNGPSRKIDIYEGVSSNPRMPDKLNALESTGLVVQYMDPVSRSTIVNLSDMGSQVADLLMSVDKLIRTASPADVRSDLRPLREG
ncbi:hypothetical protein [Candidatus Methanoprimaticola sp. MG2]|uniref:hypothetical protein n=1 Tax=Candidatus Methanoprimaticola sp. MG2 TaxID=3228838 RepID=UPI0039C651A4